MQDVFEKVAASESFVEAMRQGGNVPEYLAGDEARARLEKLRDDTAEVIEGMK